MNVNPINFGGDKPIDHRWWFWVVIAIIAAFALVLALFTIRGFRQWKRYVALEEKVRRRPFGEGEPRARVPRLRLSGSAGLSPGRRAWRRGIVPV